MKNELHNDTLRVVVVSHGCMSFPLDNRYLVNNINLIIIN